MATYTGLDGLTANAFTIVAGGLTVAAGGFTLTSGNLQISGTNLIHFGDNSAHPTSVHISQAVTDKLWIFAPSAGAGAIDITTGVGGQVKITNGYLRLYNTNTDGGREGEMWWDDSENVIKLYNGTNVATVLDSRNVFVQVEGEIYHNNNLRMVAANKLEFRDAGIFIDSQADGVLNLTSDGATAGSITLRTDPGGSVDMVNAYFGLFVTDVDGANEGHIWYDNSENRVKFYNGAAVVTVIDSLGGNFTAQPLFSAGLQLSADEKIVLRSADAFIHSPATGIITIRANGTSDAAITLTTPNPNGIFLNGLVRMGTNAGSVEGQIWFNTATKKFNFFNGTSTEAITSA